MITANDSAIPQARVILPLPKGTKPPVHTGTTLTHKTTKK